MTTPDPKPVNAGPSEQELKLAFKAFKKRLKVTQLENDSKLGGSPLTGSRGKITAIAPPNQYPPAIWDALVRQGKIRSAGHGLYSLVQT